LGYWLKY